MLDNKGFDLWADGYDKSVNRSEFQMKIIRILSPDTKRSLAASIKPL